MNKTSTEITNLPISVEDIINQSIKSLPKRQVQVRGTIDSIEEYKKGTFQRIFGDLSSHGGRIRYSCPITSAPAHVGDEVVINGQITLTNNSNFHARLQINGPVISRNKDDRSEKLLSSLSSNNRSKTQLDKMLLNYENRQINVIGTQTAYTDILSAIDNSEAPKLKFVKTNMTQSEIIISNARAAISEGSKAIIFARGGADPGTLKIWNDINFVNRLIELNIPYYTALGHAEHLHIADREADQSFTTATNIGNYIVTCISKIRYHRSLKKKIDQLEDTYNILESEKNSIIRYHQVKDAKRQRLYLIIALLASVTVWIYYQFFS